MNQKTKFLTAKATEDEVKNASFDNNIEQGKTPSANIPQPSYKPQSSGALATYNFHPQPSSTSEQNSQLRDTSPLNSSSNFKSLDNQKPLNQFQQVNQEPKKREMTQKVPPKS